jgi:hypothetical protein
LKEGLEVAVRADGFGDRKEGPVLLEINLWSVRDFTEISGDSREKG